MNADAVTTRSLFFRFFINYFWFGLVVVLLAIIVDTSWSGGGAFKTVSVELFKTAGVAVMVAAIFSYAANTGEFVGSIQRLLERIVIKRDFLGNMDSRSKRTALESLLQPSDDERNIYSKIHEYYSRFIDDALSIGTKPIREGYTITCQARYDKELKKIVISADYSYELYRTKDGFRPVPMGYEEGEEESTFDKLCIRSESGNVLLHEENVELERQEENGVVTRKAYRNVPKEAQKDKKVSVDLSVTEIGQDHWALMTFNNLQPTNNFQLSLFCDELVEIKKYSVFFVDAEYHVHRTDDRKKIRISTNQWINEGTGLTILLALPHELSVGEHP